MFVLVLIVLLVFPNAAQEGAKEGLKVAFESVIPSVVPFAVVSSALIYSNAAEKIGNLINPLFSKFHINPYGAVAFFTGLLGGYPTGCKTVCDMYREGIVDKAECEKMLAYVNNGGVIFAINVCGSMAFGSKRAGLAVFFVSALSSFITGLFLARSTETVAMQHRTNKKMPLMAILGRSVASGGSVIINIASSFVVFYALINALGLKRLPLLAGMCELTKGIMYSGELKLLPLAAFFFTFGGIGVLAQSAALCSEYDISLKKYVAGKIIAAIIAFVIMYAFVNMPFAGKEILLFSVCAFVAVIGAIKLIKKLYASA